MIGTTKAKCKPYCAMECTLYSSAMRFQPARTLLIVGAFVCAGLPCAKAQSARPAITLDEFMNTTSISAARISPDGSAVVVATESPDWKDSIFRDDLWLWTAATGLRPLTHSGSEENPQWSPDGKWIAFSSDRALPPGESASAGGEAASDDAKASRIWIISASGGEALPLYTEKLDVHSFAWSVDGTAIYYSVTEPLSQSAQDEQKEQWKDVIRWREQHHGDLLLKQAVAPALAAAVASPMPAKDDDSKDGKDKSQLPNGAETAAKSDLLITEIAPSPDGKSVAFVTAPVHKRMEGPQFFEVFLAADGAAKQLTHNEGVESNLRWSADGKWLHFLDAAAAGSVEGKYRDVQGRLYRLDVASGSIERLGADFDGSFGNFTLLKNGTELALGQKGTEQQIYRVDSAHVTKLPGLAGTYGDVVAARGANAVVVTHSAINEPTQAYLVADPLHPDKLTALTAFNPIFAQRAQFSWRTYTWKSDDGQTIEGVLVFPPGKKDAKGLRMLTFIHGGPADADGDRFGADWYDWATLAAANGWLVFRPNYRGSSGYGDDFMLGISPHIVSAPGRDILAGVDALVREGYADPDHLAIGGYSYGGYMTDWLITQTTRFKSAVTGAGAVEHAANWGNDDETYDDAWYLGGRPWEQPAIYQSEAALFQFDKVKTPTHLVQGGADIRVSYLEGVTMERALESLGIPHTFLVFPGEGHDLGKNPWHGYIKVREELKWLEKYDGKQTP